MRLVTHITPPEPEPKAEQPNEPIAPVGAHKACPACHGVFPEHMMDRHGELLLCKPCRHQAEVDAAKPKRPSYIAHLSSDSILNWGIGISIFTAIVFVGIRIAPTLMLQKATRDIVESSRKWAKDSASKWPDLSMQIAPSSGSSVPEGWQLGPNACLIERADGTIVCVTGITERVTLESALKTTAQGSPTGSAAAPAPEPATPSYDDFAKTLMACRVSAGNSHWTFTKLLPDNRGAFEQGVVFFGQPSGQIPKEWTTFKMRESEYIPGMKMTVLARNPKTGAQVPLEATVISSNLTFDITALTTDQVHRIGLRRGDGSESLFTLKEPYSAEGLIGAPVVDVRGNLAAVITLAYAPTDLDGRTTDFVAFGMHALKSVAGGKPPTK